MRRPYRAGHPPEDGEEGPQVLPGPLDVEARPRQRVEPAQQRFEADAFDELLDDVVVFAVLEPRYGSGTGADGGQQVQEHPLASQELRRVGVSGLLEQHLPVPVRGVLGRVDADAAGGPDRAGHPEAAPGQAVTRVLAGRLPVVERPGRRGVGQRAPEDVDGAGTGERPVPEVQRPAVPVAHGRRDAGALHPLQQARQTGQAGPELLVVVRVDGGERAAARGGGPGPEHGEDGGIESDLEVGAAGRQVPDHAGGDLARLAGARGHVDLPAPLRRGRVVPVAPPAAAADEPGPCPCVEPGEEVVRVGLVEGVERVKEQCVVPRERGAVDPSFAAHLSCQPL
ncbi:hypothetical protein ACIRSJ_07890 [Streptomyces virginiae]|uniref:hypothetical protein n=1 Tax=Streptomyces virginiae TaxID=1961 RepID=UPI00382BB576